MPTQEFTYTGLPTTFSTVGKTTTIGKVIAGGGSGGASVLGVGAGGGGAGAVSILGALPSGNIYDIYVGGPEEDSYIKLSGLGLVVGAGANGDAHFGGTGGEKISDEYNWSFSDLTGGSGGDRGTLSPCGGGGGAASGGDGNPSSGASAGEGGTPIFVGEYGGGGGGGSLAGSGDPTPGEDYGGGGGGGSTAHTDGGSGAYGFITFTWDPAPEGEGRRFEQIPLAMFLGI